MGKVIRNFRLVGSTYCENGQDLLKYLSTVDKRLINIFLKQEKDNKFDPYAVQVHAGVSWSKKTYRIGYVPKYMSETISSLIDSKSIEIADMTFSGGHEGKENVGLEIKYSINS